MGKAFSAEFRQKIVDLNLVQGKSIKWLAEEYDVSASTISRWVTHFRNKGMAETEKQSKDASVDNSNLEE